MVVFWSSEVTRTDNALIIIKLWKMPTAFKCKWINPSSQFTSLRYFKLPKCHIELEKPFGNEKNTKVHSSCEKIWKKKKTAHLTYKSSNSPIEHNNYKALRNKVHNKIREIREHSEKF